MDSNSNGDIPQDLLDAAAAVEEDLLPDKSGDRYKSAFDLLKSWLISKDTSSYAEPVLLAYFHELSQTLAPTTLWSRFSMIKSMLKLNDKIDIGKYSRLIAFLKKCSVGFESKKSSVFTGDEIRRFFGEAPDDIYLSYKVIAIFGICGACRSDELTKILVEHVKDHDGVYIVSIPDTKTHISRVFTIGSNFYPIVQKYINMRPAHAPTKRFFLGYINGKVTIQHMGKNKITSISKDIARFLGLPDPDSYTGHCFRRTSATLLVDGGADLLTLKRHGGWKSDKVAEGYVQDSIGNKRRIEARIASMINLPSTSASTSASTSSSPPPPPSPQPSPKRSRPDNLILPPNSSSLEFVGQRIMIKFLNEERVINIPDDCLFEITYFNCRGYKVNFVN